MAAGGKINLRSEERQLSFKVSAKAARLIGRENVANAEGAIVELVKNTYDADADVCLIVLAKRFETLPKSASVEDYRWLRSHIPNLDDFYNFDGSQYALQDKLTAEEHEVTAAILRSSLDLWIIDNGKGMSPDIIEKYWMVIGTNFKEENIFSDEGRVRTGAKGIGRFALDRLGTFCSISSTKQTVSEPQSILWTVDWSAFEGAGKILDDVKAILIETDRTVKATIESIREFPSISAHFTEPDRAKPWATGTAICVSGLRDPWVNKDVEHLFKSLSALVPPDEQRPLSIYLFDARNPDSFGEVLSSAPSDFDYKLSASVSADGCIDLEVERNELTVSSIIPEFFELPDMQESRFRRETFELGSYVYSTSIIELFPQASDEFVDTMRKVGPFDFTLLFYKRSIPSRQDRERYPYRSFQAGPRAKWLDERGGIKIYRDDFVVRPYGEPGGKMFDWLGLGQRVAANPAPASRKGWRANPQNLAGTIRISRATNEGLTDQSNREGLIENDTFRAFTALILRLIREFENDRSHVFSNLLEAFKLRRPIEVAKTEAAVVADKIEGEQTAPSREDAVTLLLGYRAQQEEIQELKTEQGMLRALATLGTVLVSFSHEMGQLQTSLEGRTQTLERVLQRLISKASLEGVSEAMNPFAMLKDWEGIDQKIRQWFSFALSSVKADKRRRRAIALKDHLVTVENAWKDFLSSRQIALHVSFSSDYDPVLRAFEIDLDSIFNNLILNSVEAFILRSHAGPRQIAVDVSPDGASMVLITYTDSGPGIDASYRNVSQIFNYGETTKTGNNGMGDGTGIGMWILDSVVNEYRGSVEAFRPSSSWGFKAEIRLPNTKVGINA